MDITQPQFVGAPCGSHGAYTFYKAMRFMINGKTNILSLGEFFFFKILDGFPVCIGEIQLLWEEKGTNQLLASVRLYFQPQDTPGGSQNGQEFGDDELLLMSEKLIVTVEDLVARLEPNTVRWDYGQPSKCFYDLSDDGEVIKDGNPELIKAFSHNDVMPINFDDVEKEKARYGCHDDDILAPVVIMTYPKYCRYRTVLKRIETLTDAWLKNTLVMAIGGVTSTKPNMRIMFCREVFEFRDLEDLEFHLEHLAPNLKGRPRKRKLKRDDSDSNGYCSDQSSASSITPKVKSQRIQNRNESRNGIFTEEKSRVNEDERMFLKNLYKFMAKRNSPIDRLPSLGFKQINLYELYKAAKKLGGYNKICDKRLWKVLYDQLGGHAMNTSAATCTRRHYERLLLPYEEHMQELRKAKGRPTSGRGLPPPPAQTGRRDRQAVQNGQVKNRTDRKASSEQDLKDEEKMKREYSEGSKVNSAQDKKGDMKVEKMDTDNRQGEGVAQTLLSSSPSSRPGTDGGRDDSPQSKAPERKVFKMEDFYNVEQRPGLVRRVPTLEVPVVKQRVATSIMSPIMQRKHAPHPNQADSPQHSAALPHPAAAHAASPSAKPHDLHHSHHHSHHHPHHLAPSSSSSSHHHHHHQHNKQQQSSRSSRPSVRQHPSMRHQSRHGSHHHPHHGSATLSPSTIFGTPQKAHSQAPGPLPSNWRGGSELWGGYGYPGYMDRHVQASQPVSGIRTPPSPAHSSYAKAEALPDPPLPLSLRRLNLWTQGTQGEVRHKPDIFFPPPDQVLNRIHTQHHHQQRPAAPPANHRNPSASASAAKPPAASTSTSSLGRKEESLFPPMSSNSSSVSSASVLDLRSGYPPMLGFAPMRWDSAPSSSGGGGGGSKKGKASSSQGSSSGIASDGGSSSGKGGGSGSSSVGSQDSGVGVSVAGQSQATKAQMVEAALQAQQPEVLLQSALFGAQFTALPRPAKPADALPAFMPSVLPPHPAFVQSLLGQGFPASSVAAPSPSPMGLYSSGLTPAAHAQLLAYGEEMMRQKALSAAMPGMSPFLMSPLPPASSPYLQPPKDSTPK